MRPASLLSLVPALLLCLGGFAHAQGTPPQDGILDDARALSDTMRRQLAEELQSFRDDLQCDAWITATSFPPADTTVRRQAQITRRAWSGERPAVLLAYDRASNSVAFSFAPALWDRYPAAQLIEIIQDARTVFADRSLTLEERFALATRQWTDRLRRMEAVRLRHALLLQRDERPFAQVVALILFGGALLAAILGYAARRHTASAEQRHYLPDIEVGMRFGAPYGGGVMAETTSPADSH
ncbi:MAG: hypothetical protein R3F13_12225 [Prosthecobacter sp.]